MATPEDTKGIWDESRPESERPYLVAGIAFEFGEASPQVGEYEEAGTPIGVIGGTGDASPPHISPEFDCATDECTGLFHVSADGLISSEMNALSFPTSVAQSIFGPTEQIYGTDPEQTDIREGEA